jgi:signal transduction histidine kinase
MGSETFGRRPARWLVLALVYALTLLVAAMLLATDTPWLGLRLAPTGEGHVRVLASSGPASAVAPGVRLVAIADPARPADTMVLEASDLLEEPDVFHTYEAMDAFFRRQGQIADLLARPALALRWLDAQGREGESVVRPGLRPVSDLPLLFAFQALVSIAGCLIACWVWALRPRDWGARLFGFTGLLFPVFVLPAAVYGTRELAIPAERFALLSATNHLGAFVFGAAFGAIFLAYPRLLVAPRRLAWLFVVFGLWGVADVMRWAPDVDWGTRYLVLTELLVACAAAGWQWRASRGQPVERAALRWFIVSLLLGTGLFIGLMVLTLALGMVPPLPQGYAFGFFLLIYVGIALGLRRYRLFDLDRWAYRMLLWLGGALVVLGLDTLFVLLLGWSEATALGASLWLAALAWFPLRQWLWLRLARRPQPGLDALMPEITRLSLQADPVERERLWDALLRRLHDPLESVRARDTADPEPRILDDGLALRVPGCAGMPPRILRHPGSGTRLFSSADAAFAGALAVLLGRAAGVHQAHAQGVEEERRRVARDLHDDVGARLLMLIHRAPTVDLADLARGAMDDLRTVLAALDARPGPLAEAIADWRAEASARCEAASVALVWENAVADGERRLDPRQRSVIERLLREGLTNALKHAEPRQVAVRIEQAGDEVGIQIVDDGVAVDPGRWVEGRGLRGMRQRLAAWGGSLSLQPGTAGGASLRIRLNLASGGSS